MIIFDPEQLAQTTETIKTKRVSSAFLLTTKAIVLLVAFSYFDAIVGGGISEVLRIGGWSPLDQKVNDMYQAGFGISVLVIMGMLIIRKSMSAILCAPLLVFYVEDVAYYLLQPLASPIIEFLIGMNTPAVILPKEYSGWLGWIMRIVFKENFMLLAAQVYLLNIVGFAVSVIGLITYARRK